MYLLSIQKAKLSVSVKIKKILYDPNLSTNLYYIETIKALEIPIFDTPQAVLLLYSFSL